MVHLAEHQAAQSLSPQAVVPSPHQRPGNAARTRSGAHSSESDALGQVWIYSGEFPGLFLLWSAHKMEDESSCTYFTCGLEELNAYKMLRKFKDFYSSITQESFVTQPLFCYKKKVLSRTSFVLYPLPSSFGSPWAHAQGQTLVKGLGMSQVEILLMYPYLTETLG